MAEKLLYAEGQKMKLITAIMSLVMCFNICGSAYAFDPDSDIISAAEESKQDYAYTINSIDMVGVEDDQASVTALSVVVDVTKTAGQNKNGCLFIALYNFDEHLLYTDSTTIDLNEGETKSYDFTVDLHDGFTGFIRAFVWDSLYSMKPLAAKAEKIEAFGTGALPREEYTIIRVDNPEDLKLTAPGLVKFNILGSPYKAGWFKTDVVYNADSINFHSLFNENKDNITMIDCTQSSFYLNIESNGTYVFIAWSSPTSYNMSACFVKNISDTQ